jgi:hypothetical protein
VRLTLGFWIALVVPRPGFADDAEMKPSGRKKFSRIIRRGHEFGQTPFALI